MKISKFIEKSPFMRNVSRYSCDILLYYVWDDIHRDYKVKVG